VGYDLITVKKVADGEFEQIREGKGYFRYAFFYSFTDALRLVGIDLDKARPRLCGLTKI
jgi:hypothetical protein